MPLFAQVILPLAVEGTFSYVIPDSLSQSVIAGCRVIVPFGKSKFYTGIVESVTAHRPTGLALKEIMGLPDNPVVVRHPQLRFWEWISEYYLCTRGEVMRAALPARLKLESETVVELSDSETVAEELSAGYSDAENSVIAALAKSRRSLAEICKVATYGNPLKAVQKLLSRGIVHVYERMRDKYKARKVTEVEPAFNPLKTEEIDQAFSKIKRAPQQQTALLKLISVIRDEGRNPEGFFAVGKDILLADQQLLWAHFKALEGKGLIKISRREVSPFSLGTKEKIKLPVLSQAQGRALDQIHSLTRKKDIVLLHGVTASGKTEIYMHLIDYVLKLNQQVLMLVPEIALTTQLTKRMQAVFGEAVVVCHSKFSDSERASIWMGMLKSHKPMVVVGARSAVFLPFEKLGLVIVDEEHESSYKQAEPAPRYNARDAAIMLASMHGAKTVLGSATPSIETYFKAKTGKFGLVELTERYSGVSLPQIETIDMKHERKKGAVTGVFSDRLVNEVRSSMSRGKQSILFLNRRGYSPVASCHLCGYVAKCDFCDVSLTYHRYENMLFCHYCGAAYPLPKVCPQCGEPSVKVVGYGTERLEEDLGMAFPKEKILRMDLDTTRNKNAYEKMIDVFSEGKASILVGTQMVTKGLDFKDVETVGVVNADAAINFPDFRSSERAFNMLSQVSGRAGRREDSGHVLVQTYNPEHPVLGFVKDHDYQGFYEYELEQRRKYVYPPFARVINVYIKHKDETVLQKIADVYAREMKNLFGNRVFGPVKPKVGRIQNFYIRNIMLKFETNASTAKVKQALRQLYINMQNLLPERGMTIYYDVDPM